MSLQVAEKRHAATRAVQSVFVGAVAALAALLIAFTSTVATAVALLAYTPIVMTGTFTPDPDSQYVAMALDDFVRPSRNAAHPPVIPDYNTPVALDTPEQAWPITGLFDHTFGRSVQIGWADLRAQIAETTEDTGGEPIIVFGYSQSAVISIHEKRRLAELYPVGDPGAPDIQFVLIGDLNRPNGGVMTRFQGGYIPLINFYFNGPAPTDTAFSTVDIARQYDGFADFPLYPVNALATVNALLGMLYVHTDYQAVSLDPESPKYVEGTVTRQYGDTTYYTIPTANLPLLQPLRDLGAPEALMALIQPALRVIIETAYDRNINPGIPTAARLIPRIDPVRFIADFVAAVEQGIADARKEMVNPTPRPAGPTPTERVVTDLVRTNVKHTVDGVLGGATGASDDDAEAPTRSEGTRSEGAAEQRPRAVKAVSAFTERFTEPVADETADATAEPADATAETARTDRKATFERGRDRADRNTVSERSRDKAESRDKSDRKFTSERGRDKADRVPRSSGHDSPE